MMNKGQLVNTEEDGSKSNRASNGAEMDLAGAFLSHLIYRYLPPSLLFSFCSWEDVESYQVA